MSLFKGLHKVLQTANTPKKDKGAGENKVFPIHKAAQLLAPEKRQTIIERYRDIVLLPKSHFDVLYAQAIQNFAEFVQYLPETRYGPYACHGGLLDHGLERAELALSLCRAYLMPTDVAEQENVQEQAIWLYAVFTVALLRDVGMIYEQFNVSLCETDGRYIKTWLPYEGAMVGQADFYQYTFETERYYHIRRSGAFFLVEQLLPKDGLKWLASDKAIFDAWLAMLIEDTRHLGAVANFIPLAEAHLLAKNIDPALFDEAGLLGWEFDTDPTKAEHVDAKQVPFENADDTIAAALAFLAWLKKGVSTKSISVNKADSSVHMTNEGVLLLPQVFMDFTKDNAHNRRFREWKQIYQQFMRLGLQAGTNDVLAYRFLAEKGRQLKGIVVTNPFHVFDAKNIPAVNKQLYREGSLTSAVTAAAKAESKAVPLPKIGPPKPS